MLTLSLNVEYIDFTDKLNHGFTNIVTFILVPPYFRAKPLCSCFICILNNLCLWKSLRVCWTWVWCVSGCSWPPRTSPRSGTLCWWTPAGPRPAACRPETAQIHRNIQILVFNGTTELLQQIKTGNVFRWLLGTTFSICKVTTLLAVTKRVKVTKNNWRILNCLN